MTSRLLAFVRAFAVGVSAVAVTACDVEGVGNFTEADIEASREASRRTRERFMRNGSWVMPIGDIVVVAPPSLPDAWTHRRMRNALEPRLKAISLWLTLPDFAPRDPNQRNEYVVLAFNQVPRDAYTPTVAEEFAQRTAGYRGPIRFNEEISYFEHPANIDRYYVFADPDFRRPDGAKPWLFCYWRIHEETLSLCGGRGGWVTDSVRWSYKFLLHRNIADWPDIDKRLAEHVPTFIRRQLADRGP